MPDAPAPAQPRPFWRNFRNWLSWSGMVLAVGGLFAFFLLLAIDQFAGHRNPYVGILAYVVAPLFFILGIFLTFLGAIIRGRTRRRAVQAAEPLAIKIDLSRPRDRRILALFVATSVGFLFLTAARQLPDLSITPSRCSFAAKPAIYRWSRSSSLRSTPHTRKWNASRAMSVRARPRISKRRSTA